MCRPPLVQKIIHDHPCSAARILRLGVAGEFFGHGLLAILGKPEWIRWISQLSGVDQSLAAQLLFLIGCLDILVALVTLIRPIPAILLWAAFWGFSTALVRPLVGASILDFIQRFPNWAAPLALLSLNGWPSELKEWFEYKKCE